jgi:hypothetical protein
MAFFLQVTRFIDFSNINMGTSEQSRIWLKLSRDLFERHVWPQFLNAVQNVEFDKNVIFEESLKILVEMLKMFIN